jgi:hypothetical protein
MNPPLSSGLVMTPDHMINLYHLNELYGNLAVEVAEKMRESHGIDLSIT